jgi:uncharacterized membrane protein YfcA
MHRFTLHRVRDTDRCMTALSLAIIGFTILSTSFVSGLFGMAGGMILVGVLLAYFDVATAMVAFSIIQFVANGWRAVLWWRFVLWRIFLVYVLGAVLSFAVMRYVAIVPSKAAVYLGLGLLPFLIELLPAKVRPNIEWRGVPFLTGVLTTVIQLLTGVGGLFLDIFFQKSVLDRKTTIATKAVTQTFSHVVRAVYFSSFAGVADAIPWWTYGPAIALSIAGTSLAAMVLERMTDVGFRQWTRRVIFAVSAIYLVRGVMLAWSG